MTCYMILSTFPFLFIEIISNIFAFSNYILIYLSKLTAPTVVATPAAALTVEAVREIYRAEAAAVLVAGINILQNSIIRD